MQIQKCIASKPGLLPNKILTFNDQVTIIYGKNDSGKTLIARAMMDTLWGELSNNLQLNGNAWDDLYMEVLFTNLSNQFRFIKDCRRSFSIKQVDESQEKEILKKNIDENKMEGAKTLLSRLNSIYNDGDITDLFNKIDIESFMNISFMPSPVEISKYGRFDCSVFQRIMLEDNSNFYSLYRNIKNDFNRDGLNDGFNSNILGEILKAENIIKDFERKMQIIDIQDSKMLRLHKEEKRLKDELELLNQELSDIRKRKAVLHNILKEFQSLEELNRKISEKKNEINIEQEKIQSVSRMQNEIKEQFTQFSDFDETKKTNLNKIEEAYREVRNIYEAIDKYNIKTRKKKKSFKKSIISINVYAILISIGFFYSNTDHIYLLKLSKKYLLCAPYLLSFIISLVISIFYIFSSRSKELSKLMKEKVDIEGKLKNLLKENNLSLKEYSLETIYEFLVQYFEEYGEFSIRQSELNEMKESLKDNSYIQLLEDELVEFKKEEESSNQKIDKELSPFEEMNNVELGLNTVNSMIHDINYKIKSKKDKIKVNEDILTQISQDIKQSRDHKEEIDQILNEKSKAEESLKGLHAFKNSIGYIMEVLEEAVNSRKEKLLLELVNSTGEKFHFLTNNQYDNIIDSERIMGIISGNGCGDELNPSVFHILLLSIKLALTFLLTDFDIALPLIIDEPFLFMDDTRVSRLKEIMDDISRKRQIIIFTHSNNYKDWGGFIEL